MRTRLIALTVLMLATVFVAQAQNRYIVYFKDKDNSPFTVGSPQQFLSQRAIARRLKQEIPVTVADLPVNRAYTQQVAAAGAKVFFTSRWLNCALVQATASIANGLTALPSVAKVEYVAPGQRLGSGRRWQSHKWAQGNGAAATKAQLEMLGIDLMHDESIVGEGVHVAILDSGYDGVDGTAPFQHLFQNNRILEVKDYVTNSKEVYRFDDHGTEVLSVIAANSSAYTGGAYEASFYLFVTEDVASEYRVEEYNWLFAAEKADSAGVDVITSSLGYNTFDDTSMDYSKNTDLDGKTAIISKAASESIKRGMVVVCSAGNEGNISWGLVTPPADVDGVIAVGSVTAAGARSSFSSKGPTSDGRIKPDVMALGNPTAVIRSNGNNGTTNGTSVAAPVVTSLLIGLIQRFPDIDPNTIAEVVVSTASRANTPDNLFGYGIPSYSEAKKTLEGMLPVDEISVYPNPTDTGKVLIRFRNTGIQATITIYDLNGRSLSTHTINVTNANNPVEISLAELPAASYLVKVKTSDNFKTFRLVKL